VAYTERETELITIKAVTRWADEHNIVEVHSDQGKTFMLPLAYYERIEQGGVVLVETRHGYVSGWRVDGEWIKRYTDQELDDQIQTRIAEAKEAAEKHLAEHRADWRSREAALPTFIRERIEFFREVVGHNFDLTGWEYELVVAELCLLYMRSKGDDAPVVDKYCAKHDVDENQRQVAKMLALMAKQAPGRSMTQTPSALYFTTGHPFYGWLPPEEETG